MTFEPAILFVGCVVRAKEAQVCYRVRMEATMCVKVGFSAQIGSETQRAGE